MRKDPCVYCGGNSFESVDVPRRPDQRTEKCLSCDKYSVVRVPHGKRYPLDDPSNPKSPPHT